MVSNKPLVSVCISAYNVERYLHETLASILSQSYRNLEIILVDNGSADRTFEVAQSFQDDRLRCFQLRENIGGYQGMNMVAGMAQGEFVAIYHSDDVYEPTIIEKEVACLLSHPELGAVFTMFQFMDEASRIYAGFDLPEELARLECLSNQDVITFVLRHGNTIFACPTFMTRRKVLAEVGLFDGDRWDIAADLEMWLRLVSQYPVAILNERLLRYRTTAQQWTHRWKHLRTDADRAVEVLELYVDKDGWRSRLPPADLTELRYQRCKDQTTRAANALILGQMALARTLLQGYYPYGALLHNFQRRKVRVLLLRGVMKGLLATGATRPLRRLLQATEYGKWH